MRHIRAVPARDDRGSTAAEYALIASLIAVVVIAGVLVLGRSTFDLFESVASSL